MECRVGDVAVHFVEHGQTIGVQLWIQLRSRDAAQLLEPRPDLAWSRRRPHYGYGFAARRPERVAGLALVCPLLPGVREVPEHRPVIAANDLGDEEFRGYFVVQTPAMLERYQRFVAPAIRLTDAAAMERIGEHWELSMPAGPAYGRPTLIVAGRRDSTVGYAAAVDLIDHFPRATLAVLEGAGHALPHEQPELLAGLLQEWLARTDSNG